MLLFCLLRPVLVVRAVEPQRNFLAVLVDDSRSMTIADQDQQPRSAFVRDAFGAAGRLRAALGRRFTLRYFRFSATAERASAPDGGAFTGTRSNIGQALQRTAEELAGLPVSGIVLLTDGADTSRAPAWPTRCARCDRRACPCSRSASAASRSRATSSSAASIRRSSVLKGTTLVVDVVIGADRLRRPHRALSSSKTRASRSRRRT